MEGVRVTSINAKGLNAPEKRRMLLNELKQTRTDVAFIQETHFKTSGLPYLQNRFFPYAYHAHNQTSKSKGVSIVISNRLLWSMLDRQLDKEGRYLFLKGYIGGVKVTLATVYAPNTYQDIFLKKTLSRLATFAEGKMILGGDFNIPLDPKVDTSTGSSSISGSSRREILRKLQEMQLIDVWRVMHMGERDYTFFSNPHQMYSRIDFFLLPHYLLTAVLEVTIGNITWSDHAPVTIHISLSRTASSPEWRWRLNEGLLQIPEIREDVAKEMEAYFQTNDTPGSDPGMLWEAHKAVMRGVLIKHGSRLKKAREAQTIKLVEEIQALELQHKKTQGWSVGEKLTHLRSQLTDLLRYKAKAAIQMGKKITYELGDKCSKILAGKLKEKGKSVYVPHIKGEKGQLITLPKDIAQRFREYYSSLYNLTSTSIPQAKIEEYLTSACLSRLPSPERNNMEIPISMEEVREVMKGVKHGKAPGPDGFTIQYYR